MSYPHDIVVDTAPECTDYAAEYVSFCLAVEIIYIIQFASHASRERIARRLRFAKHMHSHGKHSVIHYGVTTSGINYRGNSPNTESRHFDGCSSLAARVAKSS